MNRWAENETLRKTHGLLYSEKKGLGAEYVKGKHNNGDIVKWDKAGKINEVEKVFGGRKRGNNTRQMYLSGGSKEEVRKPVRKNLRDFKGNGNIISWGA